LKSGQNASEFSKAVPTGFQFRHLSDKKYLSMNRLLNITLVLNNPKMNHHYKVFYFLLFISILFIACKKSTPAAPAYFMQLSANGKNVNYTACTENEVIINGQPDTQITGFYSSTGNVGNKQFRIDLVADENNLKTGQVYTSQSAKSFNFTNQVTFAYLPDSLVDNYFGYTTAIYNPTGTVTLTEVTPTYIKGTFSAKLFSTDDFFGQNLLYTATNGTFYSSHNSHTGVIRE
jgi:hypothetical protein